MIINQPPSFGLPLPSGLARRLSPQARANERAFSLIEVTISLGIVAFALVGIMGALPIAMNSGRLSVEQTRAASIANTLFASFRTQPFKQVYYLTPPANAAGRGAGAPVDLSIDNTPATPGTASDRQIYVTFTDGSLTGEAMQFQSTSTGAEYAVALGFNSMPGTVPGATDVTTATVPVAGMASQVEVAVYALDHPRDVYRYVSIIAKRAE